MRRAVYTSTVQALKTNGKRECHNGLDAGRTRHNLRGAAGLAVGLRGNRVEQIEAAGLCLRLESETEETRWQICWQRLVAEWLKIKNPSP